MIAGILSICALLLAVLIGIFAKLCSICAMLSGDAKDDDTYYIDSKPPEYFYPNTPK